MNISWSPDVETGRTREKKPFLKQEEAQTFSIFDFCTYVLIVLYSMLVISHWLTFVANYVILSKINVTNKVGQFKNNQFISAEREFYLR